jgi:hypothetical protein
VITDDVIRMSLPRDRRTITNTAIWAVVLAVIWSSPNWAKRLFGWDVVVVFLCVLVVAAWLGMAYMMAVIYNGPLKHKPTPERGE